MWPKHVAVHFEYETDFYVLVRICWYPLFFVNGTNFQTVSFLFSVIQYEECYV